MSWGLWALANLAAVLLWPEWANIPFHFIWVSLTLIFGFRLRTMEAAVTYAGLTAAVTGIAAVLTAMRVYYGRDELAELPMMTALFLAMVWQACRRHAAAEEVRHAAEREREFVRDASHQLRTPITIARGYVELIRRKHEGEQTAEDAHVALEELNRLARISDRLLVLAAAEHPGFLRHASVDVEDLLLRTERRWRQTAPRCWHVGAVEGTVPADRERLEFALDALIENALKFTEEHDCISILGFVEDATVVLEIADTGEGIAAEDLGHVFDRFCWVDRAAAERKAGTGLGLSTVKAIAEAHGGSVSVSSAPGKGATFRIRLPEFRSAPSAA